MEAFLAPTTPAPAAVLPPTPGEIDSAIERYEIALLLAQAADKSVQEEKAKLEFLVLNFGQVPAHAEQSKRLGGLRNEATLTWSTSYTVVETSVYDLRFFLEKEGFGSLFPLFFATVTKHKLVDGARDVLKTLQLSKRVHEKIASLVGLAIDVKTAKPALKVKTIQPEKPVRTKRAGKLEAELAGKGGAK